MTYEIGQQISTLIIVEPVGAYYKVVCTGCNTESVRRRHDLKRVERGERKSCRCQLRSVQTGLSPGLHAWMQKYIRGAKYRNLSWNISSWEFVAIVTKECYYCGAEPESRTDKSLSFEASGIDRLDSKVGYEPDNVVPACSSCNYAKQSMTAEEFLELIKKIHTHREKSEEVYTIISG